MNKLITILFLLLLITTGYIKAQSELIFIADTQKPMNVEKIISKNEHNPAATDSLFARIIRRQPSTVFFLGDLVGKGSNNKLWKKIDNMVEKLQQNQIDYYAIKGNHEYVYFARKGRDNFDKRFSPANLTVVTTDSVAVVLLNSNHRKLSANAIEHMLQGYNRAMDSLQQAPDIKGIIVCTHHSPYSNSTIVGYSEWAQTNIVPTYLRTPKAILYLSGHSHHLEIFNQQNKLFCVIGGGGGVNQGLKNKFAEIEPDVERFRFFYICITRSGSKLQVNAYGMHKTGESERGEKVISIPFVTQ